MFSFDREHTLLEIEAMPKNEFFNEDIASPLAWRRKTIKQGSWLIKLPDEAIREIREFINELRSNPVPIEVLDPKDYELETCALLMNTVRQQLAEGLGFAVVDGLPSTDFDKLEMKQIYWIMSNMIERPVAQSYDGRLLYDVFNTGAKIDTRVRGDLTNQELSWHTDYGFNFPPPFIGLLTLKTAPLGGISRVASMLTAHNILRQEYPEYLERLYQPFWWNRQGEHPTGDAPTHFYPIFSFDKGSVKGRYIKWLLYKGYELMNQTFDEVGQNALETMFDIMSDPENHISFELKEGQIQYVNNFAIAHSRTNYQDAGGSQDKRHLVRIFLRDLDRRSYMG
jgi:alpha-ketoglutarate-dependent taurine dioxygenase